jgi:hypothetical protein
MPPTTKTQSITFTRAAVREARRLQALRRQATERVRKLEDELDAARAEARKVEQRILALEQLAGEQGAPEPRPEPSAVTEWLSGARIREVAVSVLRESPHAEAPIHYKKWLKLLEESGFGVEGKRPDAVFLGQISRSPLVRGTTQAGIYELDGDAPQRIAREIETLERELTALAGTEGAGDPIAVERTIPRREELATELRRAQRALREAIAGLSGPNKGADDLRAA